MTEMTDVSREARISPGCTGMYKPEHVAAWTRIVDFVHRSSQARIGLQLAHAGRKGSTRRMWEGIDEPLADRQLADRLRLADALLPAQPGAARDDPADMDRVRDDFVRAARWRCRRVSICSSCTWRTGTCWPRSSRRSPTAGPTGTAASLAQPACAFRWRSSTRCAPVWPAARPMSVRISAIDWEHGGLEPAEAVEVARALRAARVRHHRRLGRADGARSAAGVRSAVPDPVQRSHPPRGRHPHDDGRRTSPPTPTSTRSSPPGAPTSACWRAPTSTTRTGPTTPPASRALSCRGRISTRRCGVSPLAGTSRLRGSAAC